MSGSRCTIPRVTTPNAIISLLATGLAGALVGCASTVAGQGTAADEPAPATTAPSSESAPPPTSAAPTTTAPTSAAPSTFNICSMLHWGDLRYPGTDGPDRPTKSGHLKDFDQSCQWASQQFNRGYNPPPPIKRSDFPPGSQGDLAAASEAAKRLAEVEKNSNWVLVTLGYDNRAPKPKQTKYTEAGRTVYITDDTHTSNRLDRMCLVSTAWGGGVLFVSVQDATLAFPECPQAKRVMALMIQREPR